MFPPDLAKLYVAQAGQQYLPSNGTEGHLFLEEWCGHCARDKAFREGEHIDECDDNELCQIIGASFRGEAKEWVYGKDGQPMCMAFVPVGQPIPPEPDTFTLDLFATPIQGQPEHGRESPQTAVPGTPAGSITKEGEHG